MSADRGRELQAMIEAWNDLARSQDDQNLVMAVRAGLRELAARFPRSKAIRSASAEASYISDHQPSRARQARGGKGDTEQAAELDVRARSALFKAGFGHPLTPADVCSGSCAGHLLSLNGCGDKTVQRIAAWAKANGLNLREWCGSGPSCLPNRAGSHHAL